MYFCVILTENGQRSFLYLINHNNSFMFKVDSYPSQRLTNHLLAIPCDYFSWSRLLFYVSLYLHPEQVMPTMSTSNTHLQHLPMQCIACLRASAASMSPQAWPQPSIVWGRRPARSSFTKMYWDTIGLDPQAPPITQWYGERVSMFPNYCQYIST